MTTTTTVQRQTGSRYLTRDRRGAPARRFFGVISRPQSYRNIGYLLLGLLLGPLWFTVLVTGVSVGLSLLVVALLGVPVLLGLWYVSRACANVERVAANVLLGTDIAPAPIASSEGGNLWVRLRSMSGNRYRWREVGFLVLRFPAGIATSTAAAVALSTPFTLAYAPLCARTRDEPFGNWALSSRLEDVASSPWSWLLVPAGVLLLFVAFHLMNAVANACAHWAKSWL